MNLPGFDFDQSGKVDFPESFLTYKAFTDSKNGTAENEKENNDSADAE